MKATEPFKLNMLDKETCSAVIQQIIYIAFYGFSLKGRFDVSRARVSVLVVFLMAHICTVLTFASPFHLQNGLRRNYLDSW